MSVQGQISRHTLRTLGAMKARERISMLTAYDVMTAQLLDEVGIEILLVGDSLGNVIYGFDSTLPVTMDMILAHTAAVVRGSKRAFVIADLPFMSYQASEVEALKNAGRCLAEAGAQAVKVEGAYPELLTTIRKLVNAGIPVMGHIGLTPQSVHQMGGYYQHGKSASDAERLLREAHALEEAGCFAIVLECVEAGLAERITSSLKILTIGIGSGRVCDGEVLVVNDILGYSARAPKFAKVYADMKQLVRSAAKEFVTDTKAASTGGPRADTPPPRMDA
jgi:3-methyl-2-oxobutanoate hydroxymethyltransferase